MKKSIVLKGFMVPIKGGCIRVEETVGRKGIRLSIDWGNKIESVFLLLQSEGQFKTLCDLHYDIKFEDEVVDAQQEGEPEKPTRWYKNAD